MRHDVGQCPARALVALLVGVVVCAGCATRNDSHGSNPPATNHARFHHEAAGRPVIVVRRVHDDVTGYTELVLQTIKLIASGRTDHRVTVLLRPNRAGDPVEQIEWDGSRDATDRLWGSVALQRPDDDHATFVSALKRGEELACEGASPIYLIWPYSWGVTLKDREYLRAVSTRNCVSLILYNDSVAEFDEFISGDGISVYQGRVQRVAPPAVK